MYPELSSNLKSFRIDNLSGGIVIDSNESKLLKNQSPDMLNMYFDSNILRKREGQLLLFKEDDIIACSKDMFYNHFIYHAGNKIKAYNYSTKKIQVLMAKVPKKRGVFFLYNGYIYYIGAGEYYKISFKDEELICNRVEGYIPNVIVNADEFSRGDSNEAYNYLTAGFSVTYNTTNNLNVVAFPDFDIDSTKEIKVEYENRRITDFRVDWEMKAIFFSEYFKEGHNLLKITFFGKDEKNDREKLTSCKLAECFGGISAGISEGTRVFLAGNEDYGNTFFYSELKNPEYFPVNQFEILGDDDDPVMCIGKQYNGLVFFKKRSIYISYYSFDGGEVNFTVSRLNSDIGCDCRYTLLTIDNQLVWLNSMWGVMTLSSTSIKDEKNVKCISANINGKNGKYALLGQENLEEAISFINRGKFYLVTKKYTYVLNLTDNFHIGMNAGNMKWFLMDNISAKDYFYFNREAYLAGNKGVSYFSSVLYDFDKSVPIKSYFKTKAIDFETPGYFKTIYNVSFALKPVNNSYFKLEANDENKSTDKPKEHRVRIFEFDNFSFKDFVFLCNLFSFSIKRKFLKRRVKNFMLTFSNDLPESQMIISDIEISYSIERSTKYNGI